MRTISVINQKGGCGKTTVAINLAAAFSEMGKRVLLVDLDPQSHASLGLRVDADEVAHTTYDLLMNPRVKVADAATTVEENFHIVPSSPILSAIEQELAGKQARESRLLSKLARLDDEAYDYVIIDSPPNVGLLTFNALVAAGEVIIPTEPSWFSLKGLQKLRDTLALLERETKRAVHVHVLVNNLENRTTFSREVVAELEREHGGVLMESVISHSVRFKEAAMRGISIFRMPNVDRLQREFLLLADELERRKRMIVTDEIDDWMVRLHGPKRVREGILFVLDAPGAGNVYLTGEFTNWSREGMRMDRDPRDGLWKTALTLDPGEYEYRFIVDGVWIKDPSNADSVLNEFGQENSLLIV